MGRLIDLSGRRFGRLMVIRRTANHGRKTAWECVCDCGTSRDVTGDQLCRGETQSCGCLHRERTSQVHYKHGEGGKTPEYNAWTSAIGRCENQNNAKFPQYGGRGIKMCPRWRNSYEAFLADMGRRPSSLHSLDREDVDGDYEPGNCRWALPKTQARNKQGSRLVRYAGRQMPLMDACELSGLNYGTVITRLRSGASDEEAFRPTQKSQHRG
jgi:hypothetical protein